MSFHNPFARRRPDGTLNRTGLVKGWVREFAGLNDDIAIVVTEIACRHTKCGGTETLALIDASASELRVLRFSKRIAELSADDVRTAVEAVVRPQRQMETR